MGIKWRSALTLSVSPFNVYAARKNNNWDAHYNVQVIRERVGEGTTGILKEGRKVGIDINRYNIISVWIRYSSNGILVLGLRFALPCLPVFCRLSFVFILGGLVNSCSQQLFSRGKISEPSRCTPTPSQKGKKQKQTKTRQEQLCADGWVYARMPAGPEAPRLPTIGDEGTVSSRCDGLIFIIV